MNRKYKICVYAICKNESAFVDRWLEPLDEADMIVVTDTGSTDDTAARLEARGVRVHTFIPETFRFDVCRNYCLDRIPSDIDICVSLDMDEIIMPGWRDAIERAWTDKTALGRYIFNWSLREDGTPEVQYHYDRIHSRRGWRWVYPTHEILEYTLNGNPLQTFIPDLTVNHYPDKEKCRSFNLPLLELAVRENPHSARNLHYLGREYMYAEKWQNCIDTLTEYLSPNISFWDEERSASMRFIARSYSMLGNPTEQKKWLYRAVAEAPRLREPYMELAFAAYKSGDFESQYYFSREALKIDQKTYGYANEIFAWNAEPYDLAAIALFNLGRIDEAIQFSEKAIAQDPSCERLRENHRLYLSAK